MNLIKNNLRTLLVFCAINIAALISKHLSGFLVQSKWAYISVLE